MKTAKVVVNLVAFRFSTWACSPAKKSDMASSMQKGSHARIDAVVVSREKKRSVGIGGGILSHWRTSNLSLLFASRNGVASAWNHWGSFGQWRQLARYLKFSYKNYFNPGQKASHHGTIWFDVGDMNSTTSSKLVKLQIVLSLNRSPAFQSQYQWVVFERRRKFS
jgi:hypothetical protein